MEYLGFGKIRVIPGQNQGRFPFCNSLLIDDDIQVLVDPGAGPNLMQQLRKEAHIELVINTHFHFDHIAYNHVFDESRIFINEKEGECFRNRREILKRLGMTDFYGDDWARGWLERISRPDSVQSPYSPQNRHEWWLSTARLDGTYRWGEIMDFGAVRMEVVGTPGHSAGFCCLYFPVEGVVYTGDIDLTPFGPWCFGADGDLDQFIRSAEIIANLDAQTFITGHEVGIVDQATFRRELKKFVEIMERREERILNAITAPLSLSELSDMGLIYGKKFLVDEWVRAWEALAVKKHLERLAARGLIVCRDGNYFQGSDS